ncbi:MAG: nicotinate-nucleotide diphosphorylase (carboxylating) [Crocinitomicaceae bacterium]|nr:nicotinate-nucleotide diphosphorylase (carboxylating) [Crocinitomicaceae bacterium]|tara:strand:+ start:701 stop:1543 length:843 start_codon:yes stop_codon:yes gene_type:complete
MEIKDFVKLSIEEDVKQGDHSTLSCIPKNKLGSAKLLVKENGIISGIEIAKEIFKTYDNSIEFIANLKDGEKVKIGDIAFTVHGSSRTLLSIERLVLNVMQRMSAISTLTDKFVQELKGFKTKVLDTRKTTPLNRFLEKQAVKIGGGHNHRFGLYDMIMLKDNHIDFAGGIKKAIIKANDYIDAENLNLKIEIETRNLQELKEVLKCGGVDRIMLDNFTFDDLKLAVELINGRFESEASGGINLKTIKDYALSGVDYISVGALTHSIKNMDLSLKAINQL